MTRVEVLLPLLRLDLLDRLDLLLRPPRLGDLLPRLQVDHRDPLEVRPDPMVPLKVTLVVRRILMVVLHSTPRTLAVHLLQEVDRLLPADLVLPLTEAILQVVQAMQGHPLTVRWATQVGHPAALLEDLLER